MLNRHWGFSLVELMVAMAAGLLVMAAALALFISLLKTANTNLMLSRLNQEVQGISDMISRDIQRAGYHPNAVTELALNTPRANAQASAYVFSTREDLHPSPGAAAHCIRLKYWDASQPAGEQTVVRIYGYHAAKKEFRVSTSHHASANGALSDLCSSGSLLVSSQEIALDQVSFTLSPHSSVTGTRSLELTLSASYARRPELSFQVQRRILLRNQGY